MEYEKAYKDALERARKAYNAIPPESRGARKIIEDAFPELRESEDERMRRMLIDRLRSAEELTDELREWILSYLEKQKEQKPYEPKNWPADKDTLTQEQKLAWSDKDERIRKWLYDYISNCPNDNFAFYGGVGKDAVLNYLEKQKEQKKDNPLEDFSKGYNAGYYHGRTDSEQKPAEWSEEDEKMLNDCIMALSNWRDAVANYGHEVAPCQELIDWLKSLRPCPSWKPSEEQMRALQNAVALTACDKELARLYNQLKKL